MLKSWLAQMNKTTAWLYSSVFVALMLTILPLPTVLQAYRVDWALLVMVYWVMMLTPKYQLGFAWMLGLCEDSLIGTPLGEHALALVVVAYLVEKFHRQLRQFHVWQQAGLVMGLSFLSQFIIFTVQSIIHHTPLGWGFWSVPVLTGILWFWWVGLLHPFSEEMLDVTALGLNRNGSRYS